MKGGIGPRTAGPDPSTRGVFVMADIRQFRYGTDNLGYVIHSGRYAAAVDGGATAAISAFLKKNRLDLVEILNTHSHADHTSGNRILARETRAPVADMDEIAARDSFSVGDATVEVIRTPGHSRDSVCYRVEKNLISGDTLLNGTVGNCFSGDFRAFFASLKQLMNLPDDTLVCAGHDYVRASIAFARTLEPSNSALDDFEKAYDPACVYSTIGQELAVNPYFRFSQASIVSRLEAAGYPTGTEYDRWYGLMQME